ncbi:MAG: transcriptional regulator, partial [Hyphomicrobiaceae bacterium]
FDHPAMSAARAAVDLVLKVHEPFPALAVDRHWTLIAANAPVKFFMDGAAKHLVSGPVNVLRLSLHPEGLGPRIINYRDYRAHVLSHLDRQINVSGDATLAALRAELDAYPVPAAAAPPRPQTAIEATGVVVPLRLRTASITLSFFSTITMFGTPIEVTLSELAIEQFFPADDVTANYLRQNAK